MSQEKWNSGNIPDQKGRVVIITGSSSGIGFEAARVLAGKNARVILAVRNQQKGDAALERIKGDYPEAQAEVMHLDLADLSSVREFANQFKKKFDRLDLLINNAGVMIPPYGKTADGFELQFGTNHLGHFALTGLLIDLITKTTGSRIVNVSSSAHNAGNINFDDLNWEKRKYFAWKAYGDSKIANLYFTMVLQEKLKEAGKDTLVTAAHPGWTSTDLQRHSGIVHFLNRFFAQGAKMGALPTLRAAIDEQVSGGEFFGPGGFREMRGYPVKVDSNQRSKNRDIAHKLWEVSEALTGIRFKLT